MLLWNRLSFTKRINSKPKTIDEIKEYLNVESIKYLKLEDMMSIVGNKEDFCNACFSGNYKVKVQNLRKDIFEISQR